MKVYSLARKTHQLTGLILLLCTLMYFVTGYVLIHGNWFGPHVEEITTEKYALEPSALAAPEELSPYLQDRFDISGKRGAVKQQKDGTWRYDYSKPGLITTAKYDSASGALSIQRKNLGAKGVAIGMHRVHGYGGGWAYSLWALLLDLTATAMILFAVSGIYLWWKLMRRNRLLGWILLGSGWAYSFLVVGYLFLAP